MTEMIRPYLYFAVGMLALASTASAQPQPAAPPPPPPAQADTSTEPMPGMMGGSQHTMAQMMGECANMRREMQAGTRLTPPMMTIMQHCNKMQKPGPNTVPPATPN